MVSGWVFPLVLSALVSITPSVLSLQRWYAWLPLLPLASWVSGSSPVPDPLSSLCAASQGTGWGGVGDSPLTLPLDVPCVGLLFSIAWGRVPWNGAHNGAGGILSHCMRPGGKLSYHMRLRETALMPVGSVIGCCTVTQHTVHELLLLLLLLRLYQLCRGTGSLLEILNGYPKLPFLSRPAEGIPQPHAVPPSHLQSFLMLMPKTEPN